VQSALLLHTRLASTRELFSLTGSIEEDEEEQKDDILKGFFSLSRSACCRASTLRTS
jgi:hypothetical protein